MELLAVFFEACSLIVRNEAVYYSFNGLNDLSKSPTSICIKQEWYIGWQNGDVEERDTSYVDYKTSRMKIMRLGISVYNLNMLMKIPQIVFQTCNLEFQT